MWCKSAFIVLKHKPESQRKSPAVFSSFPYVQFFPVYAVPEYCPRSGGNFGTSQSVPSSAPPPPLYPLNEAAAKTSFKQKESETMREREYRIQYHKKKSHTFFSFEIKYTFIQQGGIKSIKNYSKDFNTVTKNLFQKHLVLFNFPF